MRFNAIQHKAPDLACYSLLLYGIITLQIQASLRKCVVSAKPVTLLNGETVCFLSRAKAVLQMNCSSYAQTEHFAFCRSE